MFVDYRLLLVIPCVASIHPIRDSCSATDPPTICQESGYCSDPWSNITCTEAYILTAPELTFMPDHPPITTPLDIASCRRYEHLSESAHSSPDSKWLLTPSYIDLITNLSVLAEQFQAQFPRIIADLPFLQRLVAAAAAVRTDIIERSRKHRRATLERLAANIVQNGSVKVIGVYFGALSQHLKSIDVFDPLRNAILANLIPHLHAWLTLHETLGIPNPFDARGGFRFSIAEVAYFDPLYPIDPNDKTWTLSVDKSITRDFSPPIIFVDDLSVSDYFEQYQGSQTSPEDVMRYIQTQLRLMIVNRIPHKHPLFKMMVFARASLFYLRIHPELDSGSFCTATSDLWVQLFTTLSSSSGSMGYSYYLDLFRICGKDFMSLPQRVMLALPAILGSMVPPQLPLHYQGGAIPITQLRGGVNLLFTEPGLTQAQFLSRFVHSAVETFNTGNKTSLRVLGNFVALLIIEGDPYGILEQLIERGETRNFYFNSESVKQGLCEVFNCLVFDQLFYESELIHVLRILRRYSPLGKNRLTIRDLTRMHSATPAEIFEILAESISQRS
jgi:hypothetical protein